MSFAVLKRRSDVNQKQANKSCHLYIILELISVLLKYLNVISSYNKLEFQTAILKPRDCLPRGFNQMYNSQ